MTQQETIKYIKNNSRLIVNSSHLHQHPEMRYYLEDAFAKFLLIEPTMLEHYNNKKILKLEINMGEIIGKKNCILLDEKSKKNVFYAQRKGRNTVSKFVKDIEAPDCDTITMVVKKLNHPKMQTFTLLTAYIGFSAEKEPLDSTINNKEDFLIAKNFWDNHALIYEKGNGLDIYNESIIYECPWDTFENRFSLKPGKNNNHSILNQIKEIRQKSTEITKNTLTI